VNETVLARVMAQVDLSLAQAPLRGESEIVVGAFERSFRRGDVLRLDESPTITDQRQIAFEIKNFIRGLTSIRMNAGIDYAGRLVSDPVSAVFPGEAQSTTALVELRTRDGRSLAAEQPRLIPVDDGVVMHGFKVFPGEFRRVVQTLLSPRAFESEVQKLKGLAQQPEIYRELENTSYLYTAVRGHLAGLKEGWIPVTRELYELESVACHDKVGFRVLCKDHPEAIVLIGYDPERCRIGFEAIRR
jgi:hypothetical protein